MRRPWIIAVAVGLLAACGGNGEPAEPVVAYVGGEAITAEAFRLSYEFGHAHLRRGDDPRRTYLRLMAREKVLAQEARKLRLDTLPAVRHARWTLTEELLIERVFEAHVLDSIVVTEDEVRAAVNRDAVRFQFRFLPAPTREAAQRLHDQVRARGYDAVLEEQAASFIELGAVPDEMTSPLLTADEIDPVVLDLIQDLQINTPSEPLFYNGMWYVFEVADIRRRRLADVDYEAQAPTYRKVLYNKKAMEQGAAFVAATMEPLGVTTKREGFEVLNAALWDWYTDATPVRNLLSYLEEEGLNAPYTRRLAAHYGTELVHFGAERWTIRTFLEHFTPGRYVLRPDDPAAFKARLADVVALVVRDAVLLRRAEREDLADDPAYRRTLAQWMDKWLFLELRRRVADTTAYADPDLRAAHAARGSDVPPFDSLGAAQRRQLRLHLAQQRFLAYSDSLYARYDVRINEAVLDTLDLRFSEKNPFMTVQLFKNNSNKQPFPVVDPNWLPAR